MAEIDRDKVIKGLECCFYHEADGGIVSDCDDCPYNPQNEFNWSQMCQVELNRDNLALLKEQEAVEPIPYHRSDGTIFKYECRQCRTKIFKMDLFCRHCGRKVNWE